MGLPPIAHVEHASVLTTAAKAAFQQVSGLVHAGECREALHKFISAEHLLGEAMAHAKSITPRRWANRQVMTQRFVQRIYKVTGQAEEGAAQDLVNICLKVG